MKYRGAESGGLRSIRHGDSEFFLRLIPVTRRETSFSFSLPSIKFAIFLILFIKHDTIEFAYLSSMQDA